MKIFLSYASQDREHAHSIYLALRDQGHRVFFDRADLPAGEEYHNRIRAAIDNSHVFLLLISPHAVDRGSYTLTELAIAERAGIRLLPVMLHEPDIDLLPASIKAVTILHTEGNLPGSVAAEVHCIRSTLRNRTFKLLTATLTIIVLIAAVSIYAEKLLRSQLVGRDGAPLVLVPAGTFVMGDDEDSPRREIFVDSFYMDKHEVTVSRYARFMQDTGNVKPPDEWATADAEHGGDLPVVGVDWQDATSYCHWAGRRLPTEAEWEKAARGADERRYPWGNDAPTRERARFEIPYNNAVYMDGVTVVGAHPQGDSPLGICDLSGNVWEWVADWYSESYIPVDVRNPKGPVGGTEKVIRGGGWYDDSSRITAIRRMHADLLYRSDDIGFRCASD